MIIGPTLLIVIFTVLLVSSLITSVASNVHKTYDHDKVAYDYAVAASAVGFGGLGIMIGYMLLNRMYLKYENVYLHSLLWLWVVLIVLSALAYLSYNKLTESYHYPAGAKHTLNKVEKDVAFAAFCLTLVGLSVGITYVITTGVNEGYFDNITGNVFNIKGVFEYLFGVEKDSKPSKPSKRVTEEIEMNDLISELTETTF
jgi:hypothetical protein